WSGGLSWDKDDKGNPFIATTCQGIGASIWWPNKDHGYDEPDRGMDIRVTVPEALTAVSNGRLQATDHDAAAHTKTFHWQVTNPINNYGVNLNIGNYVAMQSVYDGEGGKLDVEYWMLEHQQEKARQHFKEAPRTLAAFEHWFGKYPFYEDGYKLVVVPYLGMEHQSSVTYGNGFQNGYLGRDLSGTGVGMKFDFIIVHESAHEWWGNNVSMRDAADMWIHESFANYAENLFVEYHFTAKEAQDYVIGCRKLIRNDRPIIGTYGVNNSGSGDMYYKGGNVLHTMRHIVGDDEKWRGVLRGIQREFWHRTIATAELEAYMSRECGFDFGKYFDQYLRTTDIPVLVYSAAKGAVAVHFEHVVDGFAVPVLLRINGEEHRVTVGEQPSEIAIGGELESFELDRNFYMQVEQR
ncbi:MAG: M1 family metallopeptidase, partial [Planctomycetes bacterium]|nr:M1 family metallopeptidase [Planctomycetota bacterium]